MTQAARHGLYAASYPHSYKRDRVGVLPAPRPLYRAENTVSVWKNGEDPCGTGLKI